MNLESDIYENQIDYYMQECFNLAMKNLGRTSPNPIVGAIVLDKEGNLAGKGSHAKSGTDHAEVIALKEAGEKAKLGTLFVNLEPCCYFGKTPPCTDLIIKSGISTVIFSNYDPNPLVSSNGEKKLIENNIKTISNILQREGEEVNKFFFKWIKTKIPYITLKQAQTLNGVIGIKDDRLKITSNEALIEVHKLRNSYDAILISSSTVQNDNPLLTTRDIPNARNPLKIILDTSLSSNPASNVYKSTTEPIIIVTKPGHSLEDIKKFKNINPLIEILEIEVEPGSNRLSLPRLFVELGKLNILSVLVEAGQILSFEMLRKSLVDEYIIFINNSLYYSDKSIFNSISTATAEKHNFNFKLLTCKSIGNDLMITLKVN